MQPQSVVDLFDEPALVMRVEDGLPVEAWNRQLTRAIGYSAEEAIGWPADQRLRPADPLARIKNVASLRRWTFWEGDALLFDKAEGLVGFRSIATFVGVGGVERVLAFMRPMPRMKMLVSFYSQIAALLNSGLIHEHLGVSRQEAEMVRALDNMSAAGEDHAARIAYNIKRHRRRLGWSQEILAEKVGTYRQHVVLWESETRPGKPNDDNLERLAKVFGIGVEDLWAPAPPD